MQKKDRKMKKRKTKRFGQSVDRLETVCPLCLGSLNIVTTTASAALRYAPDKPSSETSL
jgi:hypothetical protein